MKATVNGEPRDLRDGLSVRELLQELGVARPAGIAVAINACVVRRGAFDERVVAEGDAVEIIRAVSGG